MAVGDEGKPVIPGYIAMGEESTWGTYNSATTAVEAISCGFKTEIESQKLDTIGMNRGFSKRVQLNKVVGGEMETYLHPVESALLLANAMGGAVTTTNPSTGVYINSITGGGMNTTTAVQSICFNERKGDTHVWEYSGGRVNTMKITANVGEPVKVTWEMVFKDSTLGTNDISGDLSVSSILPFTFANGVFRYNSTEAAAATTTSEEPIQSFELTLKNNLSTDEVARELGTNILSVLVPTRREVELMINQRFDTTTAYNRFIQATVGAVELFFQGPDSLSSDAFPELTIRLPKVYQNSNDPVLDGAGNVLSSEFTYDVVVDDPDTTTGKDIGVTLQGPVGLK